MSNCVTVGCKIKFNRQKKKKKKWPRPSRWEESPGSPARCPVPIARSVTCRKLPGSGGSYFPPRRRLSGDSAPQPRGRAKLGDPRRKRRPAAPRSGGSRRPPAGAPGDGEPAEPGALTPRRSAGPSPPAAPGRPLGPGSRRPPRAGANKGAAGGDAPPSPPRFPPPAPEPSHAPRRQRAFRRRPRSPSRASARVLPSPARLPLSALGERGRSAASPGAPGPLPAARAARRGCRPGAGRGRAARAPLRSRAPGPRHKEPPAGELRLSPHKPARASPLGDREGNPTGQPPGPRLGPS